MFFLFCAGRHIANITIQNAYTFFYIPPLEIHKESVYLIKNMYCWELNCKETWEKAERKCHCCRIAVFGSFAGFLFRSYACLPGLKRVFGKNLANVCGTYWQVDNTWGWAVSGGKTPRFECISRRINVDSRQFAS